jgi:hypothetical protein
LNPRLLVLTDIGQDPDDQQSLVRLLVYANEFDIEGLIATADNNYKHEPPTIHTDYLKEGVRRYGEVLGRLRQHNSNFPLVAELQSVIKAGNDRGGGNVPVFETIGLGRDSEGSEWIIDRVDAEDERPLCVAVWGGTCDLAQALWKVRAYRSEEDVSRFVGRLRVHAIGDQDSTSAWIRSEFPELFYIHNRAPEGSSFESSFRGIFLGGDYSTLSLE